VVVIRILLTIARIYKNIRVVTLAAANLLIPSPQEEWEAVSGPQSSVSFEETRLNPLAQQSYFRLGVAMN